MLQNSPVVILLLGSLIGDFSFESLDPLGLACEFFLVVEVLLVAGETLGLEVLNLVGEMDVFEGGNVHFEIEYYSEKIKTYQSCLVVAAPDLDARTRVAVKRPLAPSEPAAGDPLPLPLLARYPTQFSALLQAHFPLIRQAFRRVRQYRRGFRLLHLGCGQSNHLRISHSRSVVHSFIF